MNIADAKRVRLVDYLSSIGFQAIKVRGVSYWYTSPFRQEHTPSFKVNDNINEWYDFGIGKGGDIIDLCRLLFNLPTVSDVLRELSDTGSKHPPMTTIMNHPGRPHPRQNRWSEILVRPLRHPALYTYLRLRGIDLEIAKRYCYEIHYKFNDKSYFGIAFENRSKGYEIRNALFKGCIYNKDITYFHWTSDATKSGCCVFEGFMDFLSFLTMLKSGRAVSIFPDTPCDHIILNSVTNITKCTVILQQYTSVYCYLDNDTAGKNALQCILESLGSCVINKAIHYNGFNDLNDYLLGKRMKEH